VSKLSEGIRNYNSCHAVLRGKLGKRYTENNWFVEDKNTEMGAIQYACWRGYMSMQEVYHNMGHQSNTMVCNQDLIG
jgi:hypothetical protein